MLNCPDASEIGAAYDDIAATGTIEVTCPSSNMPAVLQALETTGFVGIFIFPQKELTRGLRIIAHKGKEGPCYETRRTAFYKGCALAALDDDNHLLVGEVPVCEKTANLYELPVYSRAVKVTKGNPELTARLVTEPVPFNCDTFESDVQRLRDSISVSQDSENAPVAILYRGPFRILIMSDGALIRRGIPARVPQQLAEALIDLDDCIRLEGDAAKTAIEAENFIEAYKAHGSRCLLKPAAISSYCDLSSTGDLTALDETPAEMNQRLLNLIDSDSEYFIITGSDVRDWDGCCPSDGVTAANRLVEAGVLQVARLNNETPGACPVNIYAIAGEITQGKTQPEFKTRHTFRQRVREYLLKGRKSSQPSWIKALRWSLLLFVAFTLVTILIQRLNEGTDNTIVNIDLVEVLDLPFKNGLLVLQFHRTQRCAFCNNMENHTREALSLYFASELLERKMAFRQMNMELRKYETLKTNYEIFTSTLLLIEIAG